MGRPTRGPRVVTAPLVVVTASLVRRHPKENHATPIPC